MGTYFETYYNKITYPIDSEKSRGLRNAQLGAIHAVSSFFTINKKDAAIVIMPTGAGQIAEDFSELRTLCVANVFNSSMKKPKVFELEHLYTEEYQKDLEQADVIVATPSCALSLSESDWAKENIDLVEVDEAHHTPAKTWQQILVNLSAATHVLFTATPFRLDRFLTEQPLIYKTVKDMTITGIDVIEGDFEGELFDNSIIEGIDWKSYDTNLKLEFRKDDSDKRVSIQDTLYKILEADE